MEIEKEMLKGAIDVIILAMLCEGDVYGYELAKRVREQSGFEMKEGTLYIAFKRMERGGLIESYWGGQEDRRASPGGRRKYYRLLPPGKTQLAARKREWEQLKRVMDILLERVKDV